MDKLGSKAIIGVGAKFKGTITDARTIEIHGDVDADLTADKVIIGEKGKFEGAVTASLVVVSGEYNGAMEAGSIWATSTARISGKVQYNTLQMDRGAALNCHVVHNWVGDSMQQNGSINSDDGTDGSPVVDEMNVDALGTTDLETVQTPIKSSKKKKRS